MRPLRRLLARRPPAEDILDLTVAELLHPDGSLKGETGRSTDLKRLSREIEAVAEYVKRLRADISRARLRELVESVLPSLLEDLAESRSSTRQAADTIMTAAEAILSVQRAAGDDPLQGRALEVLEACSFQDIVGQRLERAEVSAEKVEKRLRRLVDTVRIADATDTFDREAIMREVRREILMMEGPQAPTAAIEQEAVDRMFG